MKHFVKMTDLLKADPMMRVPLHSPWLTNFMDIDPKIKKFVHERMAE